MRLSRRGVLAASVALPLAMIGCAETVAGAIALAQQAITDAENIEAAVAAAFNVTIPTQTNAWLNDAETALSGLAPGALVPPTTLSNIFNDLSQALTAAGEAVPGNPYIIAAQVVLAALAAAWGMFAPRAVIVNAPPIDQARTKLAALPRFRRG